MKVIAPKRLMESVFPTVRNGSIFNASSLDLQFARTKTLDPRITFTRASSGTYVGSDGLIKTATTNEARFNHNPTTGESLGLLVEESRTNLLLRSEEFDNASWVKLNSTITANAITAPNGTLTADKLIADNGTTLNGGDSVGSVSQSVAGTSAIPYVYSFYAKAAEINSVRVRETVTTGARAIINLSTGAVSYESGSSSSFTVSAVNVGDGWWRIALFRTPATTLNFVIKPGSTTGDGTSGIYLWGAQLETGAFPTSYIPTTTAAVTRSADVASITGTNFSSWYRQDEGTLYGEIQTRLNITQTIASVTEGAFTSNFRLRKNSSNQYVGVLRDGDTRDISITPSPALIENQIIKVAVAVKQNDCAATGGGQAVGTQATYTFASMVNISIGGSSGLGDGLVNAPIRRLTYWPTRLSNETLQTITQ